MEVLTEDLPEGGIARSPEIFLKFMESQRELFRRQVDQLQDVVLTQCKLTGVNPLSQEMAAGALSIQIGKRPRDLLNPKAVKYMQSVFAIKDAISKKESREISAHFGVKVAQVRDFFVSQRTRVRRFVRLSKEKDLHSEALRVANGDIHTNTESAAPINPVPLNSLGPSNAEEAPSCSSQSDAMSNIDESEKQFVDNIFNMMAKEETFYGQVKLMNWILKIQSAAVLLWFLTKGGAMIIATWLSQAATEEQTSVLFVILEVLSHLPIHEAVPAHVSAILQSVNSLRFYKKSDVSNRAKALLAKWSKMFVRSQALKKPNGMKSSDAAVKEKVWKQSLSEIMGEEAWRSNANAYEEFLAPHESSETMRKLESSQPVKLLTAAPDDSNRKSLSSFYTKERRKVQLVEHPNQKSPSRAQASKVVPALANRPITVDDIKKAKLRASYMQSKYRNRAPTVVGDIKTESSMKPSTSDANHLSSVPQAEAQLQVEDQKVALTTPMSIPDKIDSPPKPKLDLTKPNLDECRKNKIQWQAPAEVILDGNWTVGGGEHSKEIDVQRNRNRRDKETLYRTTQEIPPNPKEPWDCEMDYDDTLTPLIPIMQLPDADAAETSDEHTDRTLPSDAALASSLPVPPNVSPVAAEPDLELLAVLLKNPALVIALTSAQSGNLSNEDKVRLLDLIKTGGAGNLNGMVGSVNRREEKVEVSLPSPTPSSDPGTNPFSQRQVSSSRAVAQAPITNPNDGLHQQLMNLQQLLQLQQTQPAVVPSAHELQMSQALPDMQQHLSISNPAFTNSSQRPMAVAVSTPDGLYRTQTQQPHHLYAEASIQKHPYHGSLHSGQSVSGSNTWRDGSGYPQNAYMAVNHHQYTTNLNPSYDGQRWDGNSRVPSRYPEDAHGRGYTDPIVNTGSAYRPERAEQLDPPAYWDPNKQGERWQRSWRY